MNKKDGRITQDFICIPTENSINVNIDEKLIKELKDNHEVIYMSTVECSKYDFKITRIGYLFNVSHKNDYNKMLKSFKTIPECLEFIKNYKYKEN